MNQPSSQRRVPHVTYVMARGESGRIVVEVDPALKRELYIALAVSGSTLKDWFIQNAQRYSADSRRPSLLPSLPVDAEAPADSGAGES